MSKQTLIIFIIIAILMIILGMGYRFVQLQEIEKFIKPKIEAEKEPIRPKEKQKILIVHSYHKEWGWNQDTEQGVIEGLKRKGFILDKNYEFEKFYMDTKVTYTTEEQIEQRAFEAIKIIETTKPDVVFINDDNALKYVAVPYPDEKVPFIFSGINCDPEIVYSEKIDSLEKPGHNITGALERFPYYESFSLAKKIFPEKKNIVLLADSSPSSNFLVDAFKKRYLQKVKDSPLEILEVIQAKTFNEWKNTIEEYQNKTDFLGILTYHQLRDEKGEVVPASEVMMWTINRNKLPELGFLLFHAEDGFWSAVGVSPYKNGIYIGTLAGEILEGKNIENIAIKDARLIDIAFNLEKSKMLGIEIPVDVLSIATQVFQEIKRPRF